MKRYFKHIYKMIFWNILWFIFKMVKFCVCLFACLEISKFNCSFQVMSMRVIFYVVNFIFYLDMFRRGFFFTDQRSKKKWQNKALIKTELE